MTALERLAGKPEAGAAILQDRATRRLLVRLFALALAVLVIPSVLVSFYAVRSFSGELQPEMEKKAVVVGQALRAQLGRALHYGIPLATIRGVPEFFAPVLSDNRDIAYLALTSAGGRILHVSGTSAARLQPLLRQGPGGSSAAPGATPATNRDPVDHLNAALPGGEYFDTTFPLRVDGATAGALHVGIAKSYIQGRLSEIRYDVLVALAVSLLVTLELLLFLVMLDVAAPIALVRHLMTRAEHGDFSTYAEPRGGDEVGRLLRAFNSVVRLVNGRHRQLLAQVEEVRDAHFQANLTEPLRAVTGSLDDRYRFDRGERHSRRAAWDGRGARTPLFLLTVAVLAWLPNLPGYGRALASHTALAGWPGLCLGALAPAGLLAGGVLAAAAAAMWGSGNAGRTFQWGLLVASFGLLLSGLAYSVYDLVAWQAVAGAGIALALISGGKILYAMPGLDGTKGSAATSGWKHTPALPLILSLAVAAACGVLLGGILVPRIAVANVMLLSTGLALLALPLARRGLPRHLPPPGNWHG